MTEKAPDGLTAVQRKIRKQNSARRDKPRVGPFYICEADRAAFEKQALLHGSQKAAFVAGLKQLSATGVEVLISRELLENLISAARGFRGYIDAIPNSIELPDMPGLDRDSADEAIYLSAELLNCGINRNAN